MWQVEKLIGKDEVQSELEKFVKIVEAVERSIVL